MAEHPNVTRIRDGYAAFAKGDFAASTNCSPTTWSGTSADAIS